MEAKKIFGPEDDRSILDLHAHFAAQQEKKGKQIFDTWMVQKYMT